MHNFGLVVACLTGHGWDVQATIYAVQSSPVADNQESWLALDQAKQRRQSWSFGPARKLLRLILAMKRADAFSPSASGTRLSVCNPSSIGLHQLVADRGSLDRHLLVMMESSFSSEDLESLSTALDLAVRTEDYQKAAMLRDKIKEAEVTNPEQALLWRQQKQVSSLVGTALLTEEAFVNRVAAIHTLRDLASPPRPAPGAEDGLHTVLLEAADDAAKQIRQQVDDALLACWIQSGSEEIDAAMQNGVELMGARNLRKAADAFADIIAKAPNFAEGWNKRAEVWFLLKEYQRSIDDCQKALDLKPRHFECLARLGTCHLSMMNIIEGQKWMKAALDVYPGMQGAREVDQAVAHRMMPHLNFIAAALKRQRRIQDSSVLELSTSWDVHRITDAGSEFPWAYLFRVSIKNTSPWPCALQGVARFYVLRAPDGLVFPIHRLTDGPSSFVLNSGEEYKYAWCFFTKYETLEAAGGLLFDNRTSDGGALDERFLNATLAPLQPARAKEIVYEDTKSLLATYNFMGALDLRGAEYI